jgi:hypothetical protein
LARRRHYPFYLVLLAIVTALVHVYVKNPSRRILRRQIDAWLGSRVASTAIAPNAEGLAAEPVVERDGRT